jgi:hypothetical protein
MAKFTDYALDNNAVKFKKEFERVVSDKVNDTLDALRVHVASTMFTAADIAEAARKKGESHASWKTRTSDDIAASDKRKKVKVTSAELEARARARRGETDNVKEEAEQIEEGLADRLGDRIDAAPSDEHAKKIIAKASLANLHHVKHWNMGLSGTRTHKYMKHVDSEIEKRYNSKDMK